jgi:ribosomal protein S18 acetylase RimI-like enzyme
VGSRRVCARAGFRSGFDGPCVDRYGVAGLGVMADNAGAARLYERLGYGSVLARSSVAIG